MSAHEEPDTRAIPDNGADAEESGHESAELIRVDTVPGDKDKASPELKRFWEAIKHVPAYAKLTAVIVRDPDVPRSAKVVLGIGGGYAVSPVDLVPGIIPVVGQMDDLYAMLTALQQSLRRMPEDVAQTHLDATGVTREQIDDDLAAVRDLAKLAVVKTVKFGGKALGRISRAALNFANDQLERRNTRRREATG